jgi:hypothetical protein
MPVFVKSKVSSGLWALRTPAVVVVAPERLTPREMDAPSPPAPVSRWN